MTKEFYIGLIVKNAATLEHMCLIALESTIQNCVDEKIGFTETVKHVPVIYEIRDAVFC